MITIYFKTIRDDSFKKIDDFRTGSWIHVSEATFEDLEKISELTSIPMVDLKDALDKYEIPRIERLHESIILFTRHPQAEEHGLHTMSLTIVMTNTFVITITPSNSAIIDKILKTQMTLGTTQKSKLLFHILLRITSNFTYRLKSVRNSILEYTQTLKKVDNKTIILLTKQEEILSQDLNALVPMRTLLDSVSSGRYVNLYEKDYDLLQDLMIAIKQSEDLARVNIKSIRSLRDSYQIVFTNDVNKTIKMLTAITIIFTVPTIIASVYGMNVDLPLDKAPHAFWIILSLIVLSSVILLYIFARKKWL
jgi:magnesium transporter